MLEKLHEAFRIGCIKNYWENFNLLENMGPEEMKNLENRLNNIIKNIKRLIKNNKFAIAEFICEYFFSCNKYK